MEGQSVKRCLLHVETLNFALRLYFGNVIINRNTKKCCYGKKDPTRTVNVTGDFNVTEVGGEEKNSRASDYLLIEIGKLLGKMKPDIKNGIMTFGDFYAY